MTNTYHVDNCKNIDYNSNTTTTNLKEIVVNSQNRSLYKFNVIWIV